MVDWEFQAKRFVVQSRVLYPLVQYFFHGRPYRIVTDKTIMCLEGYPRSANSFALNLIRGTLVKYFPVFFSNHSDRLIVHHTHRAATVKAAQHHGIPTLVLLRSPNEAVPSGVAKQLVSTDKKESVLINRALKEYLDFYTCVQKYNKIEIAKFETVVGEPKKFVKLALKMIGLDMPKEIDIKQVEQFAKDSIKKWEKEKTSLTKVQKGLPNKEKEYEKDKVRQKMEKQCSDAQERAVSIYSDLARIAH